MKAFEIILPFFAHVFAGMAAFFAIFFYVVGEPIQFLPFIGIVLICTIHLYVARVILYCVLGLLLLAFPRLNPGWAICNKFIFFGRCYIFAALKPLTYLPWP